MAALPSVSSIVWMTFWPASKARIEEIMSTIERAGSAPELSSMPDWTVPVAAPAAVPETSESPCLAGFVTLKTPMRPRVDRAVGGSRDRLVVGAQHGIAVGGHEPALGVERELAVARVAHALGGLDGEEAVAGDAEVERLAGLAQRAAGEVGDDLVDLHGGALRADGLAGGASSRAADR